MHACHVHFAHLLLDFLKLSAIGSKKKKKEKENRAYHPCSQHFTVESFLQTHL